MHTRTAHVLAYFDLAETSNDPTEVITGRLEHFGSALGFGHPIIYIACSLLETGDFVPPTPACDLPGRGGGGTEEASRRLACRSLPATVERPVVATTWPRREAPTPRAASTPPSMLLETCGAFPGPETPAPSCTCWPVSWPRPPAACPKRSQRRATSSALGRRSATCSAWGAPLPTSATALHSAASAPHRTSDPPAPVHCHLTIPKVDNSMAVHTLLRLRSWERPVVTHYLAPATGTDAGLL